ncbi:MAG: protoheme IX farnesyltransferase [Bacteroidales bacterium]|nr:protoheme IX farnesyltransferase [Bacteroidales bacterium]
MLSKIKKSLGLFAELSKIKIPFAVSISSLTGYLVYSGRFDMGALISTMGVFLLAGGSAALNQYQEYHLDAKMKRTQNRPIPSGRFSSLHTLIFSIIVSLTGALILLFGNNLTACLIGLLTLLWYNGIYTPMKRKTVFAVLAGAFVGAFPPMIGWTAAGGYVFDSAIVLIAMLLFIWQVPHFILLLLKFGPEYEVAGFSTLTTYFSEGQLKKLIFIWVLATAFAVMIIPVAGVISSGIIVAALLVSSFWIVYSFFVLMRKPQLNMRKAFMQINMFLLIVLILFSVDSLI